MLRFRLVLTPVGGAALIIALIVLARSLVTRNSYEILLASGMLVIMALTGITGAWKSYKLKTLEPGWKPPFPMTANAGMEEKTLITGLEASIPLFFRQHFFIKGVFFPGTDSKGCPVLAGTSVPRGETSSQLLLDFPMSGIFKGEGFGRLCDIFGFFSFSCGQPQSRTINVRSAPFYKKNIFVNVQTGAEDRRNKPAADEERYYMREYTPGDRLRDINWKSSEKIDTLITRISTDNQEKINRIEVHFRNFGSAKTSLEALWLLDRIKAVFAFFLRSLMEQNSSFIFDVYTAGGNWEIKDMEALDVFFESLACLSFFPPQKESINPVSTADVYVFSTACDTRLPEFLLGNNMRPVTLFLVQPFEPENKFWNTIKKTDSYDHEILRISDFHKKGCIPFLRWFQKDLKRLNVQANKIEVFTAEIKL